VVFCSVLLLIVERVKACTLQDFPRLLICDTAGVEDGVVWSIANSFAEVSVAFECEGFVGGYGARDGDVDRLLKTAISFRTVSCLKIVVIQGMSLVACLRQTEYREILHRPTISRGLACRRLFRHET
jgi:hypothetical protein